ncbi:MAG: T9SS type A sorting domain-containing protein [Bacteroidota bacterium]
MKNLYLVFSLLIFSLLTNLTNSVFAQSTLSAGDVAVIKINTDNDDQFAIVLLADIAANTEINFTDKAWLPNSAALRNGEGAFEWTADIAYSAGTVLQFTRTGTNAWDITFGDGTGSPGSIVVTDDGMSLANNGDQILVFQGTLASPTFIYAAQSNSTAWQTGNAADDPNRSGLPPGLTNGTHAIAYGAGSGNEQEIDNISYDMSTTSGSKATVLAAIGNTANWSGSNSSRFTASISNFTVTIFPVELSHFSVSLKEGKAVLDWTTAMELNNDYFQIERSGEDKLFLPIGQISGAGNSNNSLDYEFVDENPLKGSNYYRLRQVDFNGEFEIFQTIEVSFDSEGELSFRSQYSPREDLLSIWISNPGKEVYHTEVLSLSGQLVFSKEGSPALESESLQIPLSHAAAGMYLIRLRSKNGNIQYRKFLK